MAYTIAFDNTYPPGNTAANLISGTFRDKTTMVGERLVDIFGMPDFTSDPLKINYVRVGYGVSTKGGHIEHTNDAGIIKWRSGLDTGAGSTSYIIRDIINNINVLAVDATSDTTSINAGLIANALAGANGSHAITANGISNAYVAQFLAPAATGQSFGLYIQAGTNTADSALQISNSNGTINFLNIRGDGLVSCSNGLNVTGVITGNGSGLTNIPGANVTGTVASASIATSAGTASTAANATNSAQLGGVSAAGYALLSGAAFTGNVSVPHANSISAGSFFVI